MGKSTLINALARVNPAADGEEVFRVQNFEHQMLAEHCTNGIDVYVTHRRIILLDCQVDSNLQNHTVILYGFCSHSLSSLPQ